MHSGNQLIPSHKSILIKLMTNIFFLYSACDYEIGLIVLKSPEK